MTDLLIFLAVLALECLIVPFVTWRVVRPC